jgi:PhzF family phenazine biosynthesis protein
MWRMTPVQRAFAQVDVFSSGPLSGNPVAVVLDGDGLSTEQMQRFANWTNLSETTFVCAPTEPTADYRLRIFTPGAELPFAGHPTLGSAAAWLASGRQPQGAAIIQECGAGLVTIRRDGDDLAFAAPPLVRSGPLDADTLRRASVSLGLAPSDITASAWVDNGPGWLGLMLTSGERVLQLRPDFAAMGDLAIGVIGPYRDGGGAPGVDSGRVASSPDYEVRAFAPGVGVPEDPVTGSLNAGLAVWLRAEQEVPDRYVAAQGAALGRAGRLRIHDDGTDVWVGGSSDITITGTVRI